MREWEFNVLLGSHKLPVIDFSLEHDTNIVLKQMLQRSVGCMEAIGFLPVSFNWNLIRDIDLKHMLQIADWVLSRALHKGAITASIEYFRFSTSTLTGLRFMPVFFQ